MFNKKAINLLLKSLAILVLVLGVLYIISGFFMAAADTYGAAEAVGYFIGYEVIGVSSLGFFYSIIAALYKYNNA